MTNYVILKYTDPFPVFLGIQEGGNVEDCVLHCINNAFSLSVQKGWFRGEKGVRPADLQIALHKI